MPSPPAYSTCHGRPHSQPLLLGLGPAGRARAYLLDGGRGGGVSASPPRPQPRLHSLCLALFPARYLPPLHAAPAVRCAAAASYRLWRQLTRLASIQSACCCRLLLLVTETLLPALCLAMLLTCIACLGGGGRKEARRRHAALYALSRDARRWRATRGLHHPLLKLPPRMFLPRYRGICCGCASGKTLRHRATLRRHAAMTAQLCLPPLWHFFLYQL